MTQLQHKDTICYSVVEAEQIKFNLNSFTEPVVIFNLFLCLQVWPNLLVLIYPARSCFANFVAIDLWIFCEVTTIKSIC